MTFGTAFHFLTRAVKQGCGDHRLLSLLPLIRKSQASGESFPVGYGMSTDFLRSYGELG
ncbi:MAG: hypothetical protein SVY10_10835 [Thermodesulfobacteriota bacterium]|nr:hypothetical protein [Thermodesulfobacteriota bacterium]